MNFKMRSCSWSCLSLTYSSGLGRIREKTSGLPKARVKGVRMGVRAERKWDYHTHRNAPWAEPQKPIQEKPESHKLKLSKLSVHQIKFHKMDFYFLKSKFCYSQYTSPVPTNWLIYNSFIGCINVASVYFKAREALGCLSDRTGPRSPRGFSL